MRSFILFFGCLACLFAGYELFGKESVFAQILGQGCVQSKTETERDSCYVMLGQTVYPVSHVLSASGMWEYPKVGCLVTGFTTSRDTVVYFMEGGVTPQDIDLAHHRQVPMILSLIGFLGIALFIVRYQDHRDALAYERQLQKKLQK